MAIQTPHRHDSGDAALSIMMPTLALYIFIYTHVYVLSAALGCEGHLTEVALWHQRFADAAEGWSPAILALSRGYMEVDVDID